MTTFKEQGEKIKLKDYKYPSAEWTRAYYLKNIQRMRSEASRRQREKRKLLDKKNGVVKKAKDRYTSLEHYVAIAKVRDAIRSGAMIKQPCKICGDKSAWATHEDYDKPLEVLWLCPLHNAERRRNLKIKGIDLLLSTVKKNRLSSTISPESKINEINI